MSGDVLYLPHRIPYPPDKGDKIRSFHVLQALASRYRVHLGTFVDDPADARHVRALAHWCASVEVRTLDRRIAALRCLRGFLSGEPLTDPYYRDAKLAAWVRTCLARHPVRAIVALSSAMAQYVPSGLEGTRTVIDFVDVDSDKWRQYAASASGPRAWVYAREARLLRAREGAIARSFDASVFVAPAEADEFVRSHPDCTSRVHVVRNGVDTDHFSPEQEFDCPYAPDERALVFTGAMDYWANVDAVCWFADAIFPEIRRHDRRATFWIVGSNPTDAVRALERTDGIHVTGRVPDVRPYLRHACFAVAPLRLARGVQNKVLEAMSMGLRVLATPAAVRGIDANAPPGVTVAADAPAMIESALAMLVDAGADAGRAARAYVQRKFRWESSLESLLALIDSPAAGQSRACA